MRKYGFLLLLLLLAVQSSESCTAFIVEKDGRVLVGNNEDYWNPRTKVWFKPAEEGKYGGVYFGFDDLWPQGGMNDQGLFFDGFATASNPLITSKDLPPFPRDFLHKIMEECATVEEVVAWYKQYNRTILDQSMLMYCDREGNSVIVEGDEFVFKTGGYQICTNFYQSETTATNISCPRYKTAERMLQNADDVSEELCSSILRAVSVDYTQYSNVYDLKNGIVYLYHFQNFNTVKQFNLQKELQKGYHVCDIPELFPENPRFIALHYSKLSPERNVGVLFFLIGCAILYAFTLLTTPIAWLIGKAEAAEKQIPHTPVNPDRLAFSLRLLLSLMTVLFLIYLGALTQVTQVFDFGLPQNILSLTIPERLLVSIPVVNCLGIVVLLAGGIVAWLKQYWSVSYLLLFTLNVVCSLALLGFFQYWHLIRLPF